MAGPVASAGYSGRTLAQKLGITERTRLAVINAPEDYRDLLGPLPDGLQYDTLPGADTTLIHWFVRARAELEHRLPELRHAMADSTVIWLSWPKKASGVVTDLTEDVLRAVALPLGLVDVKVCAVSAVWSGLKLVIRKGLRGGGSTS